MYNIWEYVVINFHLVAVTCRLIPQAYYTTSDVKNIDLACKQTCISIIGSFQTLWVYRTLYRTPHKGSEVILNSPLIWSGLWGKIHIYLISHFQNNIGIETQVLLLFSIQLLGKIPTIPKLQLLNSPF